MEHQPFDDQFVNEQSTQENSPAQPLLLPIASLTSPADALHEARTAAAREDWPSVERWLLLAERRTPMEPQVHYLRGLMLKHTGDLDGALQSFRRAIYCDTAFVLAHYALAELYETRGNLAEARRGYRRAQEKMERYAPHEALAVDMTVEMFLNLLQYRLNSLPEEG